MVFDEEGAFDLNPDEVIKDRTHEGLLYRRKVPVAVLGATGNVGQRLISLLHNHPWFDVKHVCASERTQGSRFGDVVEWRQSKPLPKTIADLLVEAPEPNIAARVIFSALDSSVAGDIEEAFAKKGYVVISNARNHRMDPFVPLIVPEVNPDHLALIKKQPYPQGGCIVTNPNCVVIGLTTALRPLQLEFGIENLHVVSMQSISGAGFNGLPSLSILDNVIPFIEGEEEKLCLEPKKILGTTTDTGIKYLDFPISATCTRVPVTEGHLVAVSVKLKKKATIEEVRRAFEEFTPPIDELRLPSSPKKAIYFFEEKGSPQPKLHKDIDNGMAVCVGSLRPCPTSDYKFIVLSHNLVRGAAGGTILIGELMLAQGLIHW